MTKQFEQAVLAARSLPSVMQDDIARMVMLFTGSNPGIVDLTAEDETAVLRSRDAASKGHFATDEQIRAIWTKHGLLGVDTPYLRPTISIAS